MTGPVHGSSISAAGSRVRCGRPAAGTGGFHKIAIASRGDHIHLYIDDQHVKSISGCGPPVGDTGVIAFDRGDFRFNNFTIYRPRGD